MLTYGDLLSIQIETLADDVPIDAKRMVNWKREQVVAFFRSKVVVKLLLMTIPPRVL